MWRREADGDDLLANNIKGTKQECVDVIGEHSIDNAQVVEVGQLSFSLSRCLSER